MKNLKCYLLETKKQKQNKKKNIKEQKSETRFYHVSSLAAMLFRGCIRLLALA